MSNIIPNVVVSMPSQLFTLARKFQAASNGKIFIGKIDTDPTIPENQIQVYLENEDGTTVPVSQPLIINQAGYPVYNGQIAKFVTVQGHSMAVYDSYGSQQFYYPNVLKYDPDQFEHRIMNYLPEITIGYGEANKVDGNYVSEKDKGVFFVKFSDNSFQGDTFNGLPLKILDVYATEQSQWTITGFNQANKNEPKTYVYRDIFQNAISSDVYYKVVRHDNFYEVIIDKIYKHAFILCGRDREFTELQDAINFTSQFNKSYALDPMWLRVDEDTDYFPNLAQITIAIQSGTPEAPVVNKMSKPVRVGQNNMAGIEIVNENRYKAIGQDDAKNSCVIEYTGTLNTDDLAFLNFWKCDISEVWGITFLYKGEFNHVSQAIVRYNRTASQFKNCNIDLSGATFTSSATNVYGYFSDRENENFNCKIICPTANNPVTAIRCKNSVMGSWEIKGKPKFALELDGICQFSGLKVEACDHLINYYSNSIVTFDDASSSLKCSELLKTNPYYSLKIFIQGSISTSENINTYKGKNLEITNDILMIGTTSCMVSSRINGVDKWGIGQAQGQSGLNLYVDGARKFTIDSAGNIVPSSDSQQDLGYSSRRFKDIYLSNQPSVTSDDRLKENLSNISDKLKSVARSIEVMSFKYKDRVIAKGDGARVHFGVSAQNVIRAFESEGLNPFDYACLRVVDGHYEVVLDEILALKMSIY